MTFLGVYVLTALIQFRINAVFLFVFERLWYYAVYRLCRDGCSPQYSNINLLNIYGGCYVKDKQ
jgi:hypothetical protein